MGQVAARQTVRGGNIANLARDRRNGFQKLGVKNTPVEDNFETQGSNMMQKGNETFANAGKEFAANYKNYNGEDLQNYAGAAKRGYDDYINKAVAESIDKVLNKNKNI